VERVTLFPLAAPSPAAAAPGHVLVRDGVYDWTSDPMVSFSPTLRRDGASRRKLFPRGLVEISARDAEQLGVRSGWPVRLRSAAGEAILPAVLRDDLEPRVVLVPHAFRNEAAELFGDGWTAEVQLARA
jgi:anaerobic selenocysteine-containing dehydrogenase